MVSKSNQGRVLDVEGNGSSAVQQRRSLGYKHRTIVVDVTGLLRLPNRSRDHVHVNSVSHCMRELTPDE